MTVRPARPADLQQLREMAEQSGFPYPEPSAVQSVYVVTDDDGRILCAAGVKPILETYLWTVEFEQPHAAQHALRLLHEAMAPELRSKGWAEVNCFLPPQIAKRFGRRLERTFGWRPNWPSWFRKI